MAAKWLMKSLRLALGLFNVSCFPLRRFGKLNVILFVLFLILEVFPQTLGLVQVFEKTESAGLSRNISSTFFSRFIGPQHCNTPITGDAVFLAHDLCVTTEKEKQILQTYYKNKIVLVQNIQGVRYGCTIEEEQISLEEAGALAYINFSNEFAGVYATFHTQKDSPINIGTIPVLHLDPDFGDILKYSDDGSDPNNYLNGTSVVIWSCKDNDKQDIYTYVISPVLNAAIGVFGIVCGYPGLRYAYIHIKTGSKGRQDMAVVLFLQSLSMILGGFVFATGMSGISVTSVFGDTYISTSIKFLLTRQFGGVDLFCSIAVAIIWRNMTINLKNPLSTRKRLFTLNKAPVLIFLFVFIIYFDIRCFNRYLVMRKTCEDLARPILGSANIFVALYFTFYTKMFVGNVQNQINVDSEVFHAATDLRQNTTQTDTPNMDNSSHQQMKAMVTRIRKYMNLFIFTVIMQTIGLAILIKINRYRWIYSIGYPGFLGLTRYIQGYCKILAFKPKTKKRKTMGSSVSKIINKSSLFSEHSTRVINAQPQTVSTAERSDTIRNKN